MGEEPSFARHIFSWHWIGMLILAIVLAAGFVTLSHWQLSRSVATAKFVQSRDTETIRSLDTALPPNTPLFDRNNKVMVRTTVQPIPNTLRIIRDRHSANGPVYWVVGATTVTSGRDPGGLLTVVYGRTSRLPDLSQLSNDIGTQTISVVGRLYGSEAPQPELDRGRAPNVVSVPALVTSWNVSDQTPVYGGFVILKTSPAASLDAVPIPAPAKVVERNMLNVFYAIEWIFFAGFALFLWWRLAADDFKRQQEREALLRTQQDKPESVN